MIFLIWKNRFSILLIHKYFGEGQSSLGFCPLKMSHRNKKYFPTVQEYIFRQMIFNKNRNVKFSNALIRFQFLKVKENLMLESCTDRFMKAC